MATRTQTLAWAVSVLLACGGHGMEPLPTDETPGESPPPEAPAPELPVPEQTPSAPTWVTVPPSDPRIQYTGRVDLSAGAAAFSYPGVSIKVWFSRDALELLLIWRGLAPIGRDPSGHGHPAHRVPPRPAVTRLRANP
ncbi:hypothetical protein NR798_34475 [Archangium gephyra]|uniref:hypothetical protein n=1 Tax=Archangium gephyra TaxID=48 RepID=UPI0035D48469